MQFKVPAVLCVKGYRALPYWYGVLIRHYMRVSLNGERGYNLNTGNV